MQCVRQLVARRSRLLQPRRALSYPREPLTQPIPGLATGGGRQPAARAVGPSHSTEIRLTRLENGIRVASQEAFGQYSTVGVVVDAGSRYELDYTSGVSHVLQKLAFQSTSQFGSREDLMLELEKYGGLFDCQRFRDVMVYSLSAFSFAVPDAVGVLAEAIWRPGLKPEELDMERQSIRFELENVFNDPNSEPMMTELIHKAAYRDNTLGFPNFCPEENIDKYQVDELKVFLASHYTPSRMVLAGVNVDHDKFVDLAQKNFVGMSTSWDGIEPKLIDQSISQYTSGQIKVPRSGPPVIGPNPLPELTHIALALESSSYLEEDFFAFAVLNSLMGGGGSFSAGGPGKGMFTKLYVNVLTRNHWVYSALAQNHAYSDSGIFCIFGSAHPSKARDLTDVLCRQFVDMTHPPHALDLARAKRQLQSSLMMNLESRLIVFEDMGRQVLGQDKRFSPEELSQKIDAVTAEDLERVGKRLMQTNPSVAAMGDLSQVPERREIEEALFNNRGILTRPKSRLFSFR